MLEDHIRQYRHNNSDEFVFAYDKEGIDSLFKEFIKSKQQMLAEIGELEKSNRELEDLLQKYQDKYFNLKYGAHK